MSAYLPAYQLAAVAGEVAEEFERLMTNPRIVSRPRSKQWQFLRHCLAVTLRRTSADFACSAQQAVQYRFEVEDRLHRYYLLPGRPLPFVFRLMHLRTALSMNLTDETYPQSNGYVLLVSRDAREAIMTEDTRDVLERVVNDATDAEWAVYYRLPDLDLEPLERGFLVGGPAYKRIQFVASRHHERRWTIAHPSTNPSTKRVIDVRVLKLERDHAEVRTKEYWYLRWYSLAKGDYAQIEWRETNIQKYMLVRQGDRWLVDANFYPPPRGSAPYRKSVLVG